MKRQRLKVFKIIILGTLVIAFMPSLNQLTHIHSTATLSLEKTQKALESCVDACLQDRALVAQILSK